MFSKIPAARRLRITALESRMEYGETKAGTNKTRKNKWTMYWKQTHCTHPGGNIHTKEDFCDSINADMAQQHIAEVHLNVSLILTLTTIICILIIKVVIYKYNIYTIIYYYICLYMCIFYMICKISYK